MSYLFEIKGNSVTPSASLLILEPFKTIWGRNKDKSVSLKELAYCEFMASSQRSNPFAGYPEANRSDIIIQELFGGDYNPDEVIQEAIEFIKRVQTEGSTTYSYYIAAKASADSMKEFFHTIDLNERNDRNMPIYKPKDITSALIDTEKVIQNLNALQKKVEEELYDTIRTRSDKVVSPFANPSSLKKNG